MKIIEISSCNKCPLTTEKLTSSFNKEDMFRPLCKERSSFIPNKIWNTNKIWNKCRLKDKQ